MQSSRMTNDASAFTQSVIRAMTLEANKYGAVNLSQGTPEFTTPVDVKSEAETAIHNDNNQYSIPWGTTDLRNAVAEHAGWHLGLKVDPETEVTITCGSTGGMFMALRSIINRGDKVIIPQPYYENYSAQCILTGAEPVFVNYRPQHGQWVLDLDQLKEAFRENPKAIILCNPNNPTGTVLTDTELRVIASLCLAHGTVAIIDEVYEHIIYDGNKHLSLASYEGMHDLAVTINTVSKTYAASGWRVGAVIASAERTAIFRRVADFLWICPPTPLQAAATLAYRLPKSYYEWLSIEYTKRRDMLCHTLTSVGFEISPPQGAYYIMAKFESLSKKSDIEFANWMIQAENNLGVATVPGSCFFSKADKEEGKQYIRFCFCKTEATLFEADWRLKQLFQR